MTTVNLNKCMSINYNSLTLVANGQLTIKTLLFISVYCIYMYNNILHVIIEYAFTHLITITLMHPYTYITYNTISYYIYSLLNFISILCLLSLIVCVFLSLTVSMLMSLFMSLSLPHVCLISL